MAKFNDKKENEMASEWRCLATKARKITVYKALQVEP